MGFVQARGGGWVLDQGSCRSCALWRCTYERHDPTNARSDGSPHLSLPAVGLRVHWQREERKPTRACHAVERQRIQNRLSKIGFEIFFKYFVTIYFIIKES